MNMHSSPAALAGAEVRPGPRPAALRLGLAAVAPVWELVRVAAPDIAATIAMLGAVAFFYKGLLTGDILVSYDLFTYFYPLRDFTDSALRAGRLPLWNPYLFLGSPFLSNIQTAVFYPLWWPFIFLDAPHAVLSSVLLHVLLAGLGMYGFARASAGLSPWGALGAALPFMLGGYVSQKVGNPNQLQVIAWLPLLLLTVDRAQRGPILFWTLLAGIVLALQVLAGHPQMVYLSLWAAGLLALYRAIFPAGYGPEERRVPRLIGRLARAAISLLGMGIAAVGLAAAQVLPTLELLPHSIRGAGLTFSEGVSFSLPYWELLRATLPSFKEAPGAEFVAYIGFLPLGLGLAAIRRGGHQLLGFCLLVGLVSLFLALGGYNPLYESMYGRLPGLNQFRVPARWLLLFTFAGSLAAGIGLEALYRPPTRRRRLLLEAFEALALWAMAVVLVWLLDAHLVWPETPQWTRLWLGAALAALLVGRLGPWLAGVRLGPWLRLGPALAALALLTVAGELYAEGLDLQRNRPVPADAYTSLRTTALQLLARENDSASYRVLSLASSDYTPGDREDLRLSLGDLSPQAQNEYIAGAKYKDILAPNLSSVYEIATVDGYDGGVLPLQRYVDLRTMLVESGGSLNPNPRQRDAVLRFLLDGIPSPVLMGALNVRYLLTDKLNDLWIDNAYYDMNFTTTVVPGRRVDLVPPRPFEATGLGIVSFVVEGYLSPQGEQVAQVTVEGDDGRRERFILRFGVDTAQGDLEVPELRHQPARIASPWRTREQAFHYIATLPLKAPLTVRRIEVIGLLNRGVWHVRALSLTDQRTGASVPVPLDGRFSQAASGDLKLYRLETEQPRVSIERAYRVEPDSGRALGALEQRGGPVLLEEPPAWSKAERPGGVLQDGIEALEWTPERIVLRASVRSPALLYLRETHFPGWRVWVDGEEGKMLLANGIFRAVALSAGSHTVEFRYEPVTLRMGVQLSLTSLMVVGSLVVVALATLWWRADASL
ncbi:MAG TPA: YfhO family protein [Dehalococcoidia bacterium]|nr:YfhO family protein [Dehalococcoidia bacterium]